MPAAPKYDEDTIRAASALLEIKRREQIARLQSAIWTPQSDAQRMAIASRANELFYGGAAGGGKSDLLLGLALTRHYKSVIIRREFTRMRALIERSREILGSTTATYNEQLHLWRNIPAPKIKRKDGSIFHQRRMLEFGHCKSEDDKNNYQGRDHGLKGFDELPQFTRSQYSFIIGWTRATNPFERERIVSTGNPPMTAEEAWVIPYFGPWLDARYAGNGGKAKPGELRWFATIDGKDTEVDEGRDLSVRGIKIRPRSRTFLPARLTDNPILLQRGYADVINAMPEPLRSLLLFGDYNADYALQDDPWQVIPTAWIDAAMERWRKTAGLLPPVPLTCLANDVATANDRFVIAKRYEHWYDELIVHPGMNTPDGVAGAKKIAEALGLDPELIDTVNPTLSDYDKAIPINIDVLGGGADVASLLRHRGFKVFGIHGNAASHRRDSSGYMSFLNLRAEMYWMFREALDPAYGNDVMLPPDDELREELASARWTPTARGIQIEDKLEIKKRLGRSPDKADTIIMAWIDMENRTLVQTPVSTSVQGFGVGGPVDLPAMIAEQNRAQDARRDKRKKMGSPTNERLPFPEMPTTQVINPNQGARPIPVRENGEIRYIWEPTDE